MIKLILSDMDETLISYGMSRISPRTIAAIHACQAEGLVFGPATGRNPLEVADFLCNDARCYQTGIMVNGQQVFLEGRLVREVAIDAALLARLADRLRGRRGCALLTYRADGVAEWFGSSRKELEPIIDNATRQGDRRVDAPVDHPAIKVGIIANIAREEELTLRQELVEAFPELDFPNTVPTWFDVVPHGLSKADGIEILQHEMGIGNDEICVFGDAPNDLEMFARVHHSCAVANATPEAAAAARWHVGAASEDGVAIALEQIAEAARQTRLTGIEVVPAFMR